MLSADTLITLLEKIKMKAKSNISQEFKVDKDKVQKEVKFLILEGKKFLALVMRMR